MSKLRRSALILFPASPAKFFPLDWYMLIRCQRPQDRYRSFRICTSYVEFPRKMESKKMPSMWRTSFSESVFGSTNCSSSNPCASARQQADAAAFEMGSVRPSACSNSAKSSPHFARIRRCLSRNLACASGCRRAKSLNSTEMRTRRRSLAISA